MTYATTDDLERYLSPTPPDADLLLTRASRLIDRLLTSAVYEVDDTGMPVDEQIAAALRDATCEQTVAWIMGGEDGTGAASEYTSVTIGSVSLARASGGAGTGSGGPAAARPAPQTLLILQQAGLLGHAPRVV
ncbi:MAG TPA: hypothetical protein VIK92_08010 [Thermaerobacter sp.]